MDVSKKIFIGIEPSDRRVLIESTAPLFFSICYEALYGEVVLSIAKLCDPAASKVRGGKIENLSIKNLIQELEPVRPGSVVGSAIEKFYQAVGLHLEPVKNRRDKKIAHSDLISKMDPRSLPHPKEADINALILAINHLCNEISVEYLSCSIDFTPPVISSSTPEHFFNVLRAGVKGLKDSGK